MSKYRQLTYEIQAIERALALHMTGCTDAELERELESRRKELADMEQRNIDHKRASGTPLGRDLRVGEKIRLDGGKEAHVVLCPQLDATTYPYVTGLALGNAERVVPILADDVYQLAAPYEQ